MSWNSFTYAMGNISNMLNFANGMLNKSGGSFVDRMANSGTNLVGNTIALKTAKDTRTYTGSSVGYTGFFRANGNAQAALQNTMEAATTAYQIYTPMYYNMYNSNNIFNSYNMNNMSSLNFLQRSNIAGTFGGPYANNNRFNGYWA